MRKPALLVGLAVLLVFGCQKAEGVAPTELDGSTPSPRTELSRGPACVVPMPETPLPPAKPAETCLPAPDIALPLTHGSVTFVGAPEKQTIDVELAQSPTDQQRGLMYRTTLGENAGMLFSWPDERVRTFWMHNTCLPLDMLFITKDGFITGILEQVPVLNDDPRSIACPAAHVLEVNAGYCRKHGIAPGQRVQLSNH